jgi:hypothetical protein
MIFSQTKDQIVAQAVCIFRLVAILVKRIAVITVEPVLRSDPKKTSAILKDIPNSILRQAFLARESLKSNIFFDRITVVQTENQQKDKKADFAGMRM